MSLSIRSRLTLWIAFALILTLLAVFLTLRFTLSNVLNAELDDELAKDAGQVSAQVAITGSLERADLEAIVGRSLFVVVFRDPDGTVLAATPGTSAAVLPLSAQELARVRDQGQVLHRTLDLDGESGRVRSARISIGNRVVGVLQVAESAEAVEDVMQTLQWVLIVVGLAAAVLTLGVGY